MNKLKNNQTAKQIMQALSNDERNFNEFIPIQSVIKTVSCIEGVDDTVKGKLFDLINIPKSLFGHGYVTWKEQDPESTQLLIEVIINATYIMRDEFLHPYNAMMKAVGGEPGRFYEDKLHHFMAGLIECETLADFVYVCPVERRMKR